MKYVVLKDDLFPKVAGIFDEFSEAARVADEIGGKVDFAPYFQNGDKVPLANTGFGWLSFTFNKKEKKLSGKPVVSITKKSTELSESFIDAGVDVTHDTKFSTKYVIDIDFAFKRGSDEDIDSERIIKQILDECMNIALANASKYYEAEDAAFAASNEVIKFIQSKYLN